ncbi:MAG TPA: MASE1 domain-containing protein [Pseudolabrys sp.]|nr:MASE1 domain-containing protein [Pseudolabrys sp.]
MAVTKVRTGLSSPAWLAPIKYAGALVVVAIAYFVLAKLGLQLALINPSASPIWPPTGFALAAVLLGGYRIWPAIFAGAFAANATTAGTLETSAVIALGNTLEGLTGGFLINLWAGGRETFATPARVAKFVLISAGPATVISASVGVLTLSATDLAPWEKFVPIWATWWMGDVAGALVVTPVIVLWAESARRAFDYRQLPDTIAVLGSAAAVGFVAFSPLLPRSDYTSPLGFLAILPLLWAALRRGPRDTATVGLLLTGFAVWGTINHAGPFADTGLNESVLLLLTFMISVSMPSLALSADVALRRTSEENLLRARVDLDRRVRERTAELADANIKLTEAQRLANLGSWSWDVVANRVSWSDQLFQIYGIRRDEFGGTVNDFFRSVHPDDRALVSASVAAALKSGTGFSHEERIVRPGGEIRHLQSVGEVVRDEKGAALRMLGVCLDVTERRRAESALRESEQNYRFLLKGVRDYAIYMLDTEGHVRSWSESAQRIKGYSEEEIVGRHVAVFLPWEARVADMADQILMTAAREGQFKGESWLVRKDGSRFYGSIVLDAIRNEAGDLVGFAKLVHDVTQQHEAQLALDTAREQMAQAQKMEALGQLTGGIAHDFNNLLMIVSGYAQILQSKLSDAKDVQAVQAIRAAAGRGEKLTRQLLAFSRRQQLMPVVVDLHARIDAVRDMLATSLRGNIELVIDVEDKVWPVEVDQGELELALVNIGVNARDAMPDGGRITLSARNVVLKPGSAAGPLEGDFVALAVIDTGVGIAPDLLARVFEPFFTTKPVGKGTGLGLSQVHGFANQSGGAVTVSSEEGAGTVVTIYLPRSTKAADVDDKERAKPDHVQGTVMMVEDSRDVAEVTATLLEQLGYRVVRAENAAEALRHLQQGIEVDLLFSDIVMPGSMDGIALAQACQERYPHIPVLLTSGFSDAARAADGRFDILRKPFELSALERAIETAISGNGYASARGNGRGRAAHLS